MSKEVQSVSARAETNCGVEAKTRRDYAPLSDAFIEAGAPLEKAIGCLQAWFRVGDADSTNWSDLQAPVQGYAFSAALCDLAMEFEQQLESIEKLAEAYGYFDYCSAERRRAGGAIALLDMAIDSNELSPLRGAAVLELLLSARAELHAEAGLIDQLVLEARAPQ
jgi:hypothetical protein